MEGITQNNAAPAKPRSGSLYLSSVASDLAAEAVTAIIQETTSTRTTTRTTTTRWWRRRAAVGGGHDRGAEGGGQRPGAERVRCDERARRGGPHGPALPYIQLGTGSQCRRSLRRSAELYTPPPLSLSLFLSLPSSLFFSSFLSFSFSSLSRVRLAAH